MATGKAPHEDIEADVRPAVAMPRAGLSGLALACIAVLLGTVLFVTLESRRRGATQPVTRLRASDAVAATAPPPALYVPPEATPILVALPAPLSQAPAPPRPAPVTPAPTQPQIVYVPQTPQPSAQLAQAAPVSAAPTLVIDTGAPVPAAGAGSGGTEGAAAAATTDTARARAGNFSNRSTTVPQGTLIPAVLESALDSTRAGFARAIVSRDVRGFDGTRVLVPRGSRLIGEYRSDTAPGQKRLMVLWTRLIRPDGVTIAIVSGAGDPLGRAGIGAQVNSHFFQRFAGAILQSALNVGVNLASRAADGTVIYALPGLGQGAQVAQPQQIPPTLRVRQGTSISIFVARDLDFTGAERQR